MTEGNGAREVVDNFVERLRELESGVSRRRREKPRMRNRDSRRDGRDGTRDDYKRRTKAAATHARETRPFRASP